MPELPRVIGAIAGIIVLGGAVWGFLLPPVSRGTLQELHVLLDDYSGALAGGETTRASAYSPEMQDLIEDRRQFYADFFDVGLTSELQTLTSAFDYQPRRERFVPMLINTLNDTKSPGMLWDIVRGRSVAVPTHARVQVLPAGRIALHVTEVITFHARYTVPPDAYPRVLGARWALEKTNNPQVKRQLQEMISSDMDQVRATHEEGYETVFIVHHTLVLQRTPAGLQAVEDTFTNHDTDVSEVDHVSWVEGHFVRDPVDFTTMADYRLYHTSVEEIGESLLRRYWGTW